MQAQAELGSRQGSLQARSCAARSTRAVPTSLPCVRALVAAAYTDQNSLCTLCKMLGSVFSTGAVTKKHSHANKIQSPLSENWKTGTSVLYRELQTLIAHLYCPYSEQRMCLQLSCFNNLRYHKAEDNPGAHLCKMPANSR